VLTLNKLGLNRIPLCVVYIAGLINRSLVESMYAALSDGCAGDGANSHPTHSRVFVICSTPDTAHQLGIIAFVHSFIGATGRT
jgi:hypothetical protein